MEIKKSKSPDYNKFVGKPNQSYTRMEKLEAMQKACRAAMDSEPEEKLEEAEIINIFSANPLSWQDPMFQSWGNEYIEKGWNIPLIEESVGRSKYFKLNRMALYIRNNLQS